MAHKKAQDVWRIRFSVHRDVVPVFENALEPLCDALTIFGDDEDPSLKGMWELDAYSDGPMDMPKVHAALALAAMITGTQEPVVHVEHHAPRNWLVENLQTFPPIRAGRFFVHGSHWQDKIPAGSIPLLVDAATAFGTGEHQSTYGCLLALSDIAKRAEPMRIGHGRGLDMGCGSGILAMAMAKLWKVPVVATDIDEESVRVTRYNARLNGVADWMTCFPGDGFKSRQVPEGGPYDVICANILARPLCSMAKPLSAVLAPGGRVILAGLLERQEPMVLAAYRAQGLRLIRRYSLSPWVTLVLG